MEAKQDTDFVSEFKHDIDKFSSQLNGGSEPKSFRSAKPFDSMVAPSERSDQNPLKLKVPKNQNPYLGKSPGSNFQKHLKKPPMPAGVNSALNSNQGKLLFY